MTSAQNPSGDIDILKTLQGLDFSCLGLDKLRAASKSVIGTTIPRIDFPSAKLPSKRKPGISDIKDQVKYYLAGPTISDYSSAAATITPIHTASTGEIQYRKSIIGSRGRGLYEVRIPRVYNPDLAASIRGYYYADLTMEIFAQKFRESEIRGIITGWVREVPFDLQSILNPFHTSDIDGSVYGIPGEDIFGELNTVPYVPLGGSLQTIPYVALYASAGGHLPALLGASIGGHLPVDLPAFLRSTISATADLGASITRIGYFEHLPAYIHGLTRGTSDLRSILIVRMTPDLFASINGSVIADIAASLTTQREKSIIGVINGWRRQVPADITAVIRRQDSATKDLPVYPLRAVISTHTSDKPPNLHKPAHLFPNNKYVFGSRSRGLYVLILEPIFGRFPDLHAQLNALPYLHFDLGAYLNINKCNIQLIPSSIIYASIFTSSGYKQITATIKPIFRDSTGTSPGSGYTTVANAYTFYIATNRGFIVPQRIQSTIRVEVYNNSHPRPDLNAYISGHHQ
jgi:hypothetical protein